MKHAILNRFAYFPSELGTFGRLSFDGFACYTVERRWMDNLPYVSCIPKGSYICKRITHSSKTRGQPTFEVTNVSSRSAIQIHPANFATELQGCIAVGREPTCIEGRLGVPSSGSTFATLMKYLDGVDEFTLDIMSNLLEYP